MNWQKILFKCNKCGKQSWMEVDLDSFVVSIIDLICDDCNPGK